MNLKGRLKPVPKIRPLLNVGCLMDIPTGSYYLGKHGESILNGGIAPLTGIGGRPNTYKSALAHAMNLIALSRYTNVDGSAYDTELSLSGGRLTRLGAEYGLPPYEILEKTGRYILTSATEYNGDSWFEEIKNFGAEKVKDTKGSYAQVPFYDHDAKTYLSSIVPTLLTIDSLSRMNLTSVMDNLEKHEIGNSKNNMNATKDSGGKYQMMIQLPVLSASSGLYITSTAHVDDDLQLDPYAPNMRKLSFLKNKLKFKNVSNQFYFLKNNLWYCYDSEPYTNSTTKAAEYPTTESDKDPNNKDQMKITIANLRGKFGGSGTPYTLVMSQSKGLRVGLTEFDYIKSNDRFGISGTLQNYYLDLCPHVKLSRTTVGKKVLEHADLKRALEITSEMHQIYLCHDIPPEQVCTPAELYEDLKNKGYDWSVLLNTRGYWIFNDAKHPQEFLSTLDLLRMRVGLYHPYWMDPLKK